MDDEDLEAPDEQALAEEEGLPPVVARMVVEIRSDGTRTVARGAIEDVASGQRVAIQTGAPTPMQLSASLTRALLQTPGLLAARLPGMGVAKGIRRRLRRLRGKG